MTKRQTTMLKDLSKSRDFKLELKKLENYKKQIKDEALLKKISEHIVELHNYARFVNELHNPSNPGFLSPQLLDQRRRDMTNARHSLTLEIQDYLYRIK